METHLNNIKPVKRWTILQNGCIGYQFFKDYVKTVPDCIEVLISPVQADNEERNLGKEVNALPDCTPSIITPSQNENEKCCFPATCCMAGEHTRDECHTPEMLLQQDISMLEEEVEKLEAENSRLRQELEAVHSKDRIKTREYNLLVEENRRLRQALEIAQVGLGDIVMSNSHYGSNFADKVVKRIEIALQGECKEEAVVKESLTTQEPTVKQSLKVQPSEVNPLHVTDIGCWEWFEENCHGIGKAFDGKWFVMSHSKESFSTPLEAIRAAMRASSSPKAKE